MRRALLLIIPLCIASLGQAPAVKGGTVTGTVNAIVKGKPITADDVYVYLQSSTPVRNSLGKGVTTSIQQKLEKREPKFDPKVVVIPRGAKIFFPNRDTQEHNVFSPTMKKNNWYGFDLGKYGPDKIGRDRQFLQDGEFDIYCDIHKEMHAKVKVVPSLYFTRVVGGKFSLTDIPPGTYTLVAWAPDSRETRTAQPFEVKADTTTTAEALNVQYTSVEHPHPRMDGREYGTYPTP